MESTTFEGAECCDWLLDRNAPLAVAARRPFSRGLQAATVMMQAPITANDRNWAMAAHLSALVAIVGIPLGHILGPLVVYLARGQAPFVGQHAKASLNYQLTVSIAAILSIVAAVSIVLALIVVGILARVDQYGHVDDSVGIISVWAAILAIVLGFAVASIIFIIKGSIAASEGRSYTYPFSFRFFQY